MKQGSVELGISGIEECFDSLLFEDTWQINAQFN
jgi:hypothetical protein